MALHENMGVVETTSESLDYVTERGKPMPSLNHGTVQANLIGELRNRFKTRYRVISELSLDLFDWPSVPDISLYPRMPLDLNNDVVAMTEPPLCTIEIISPTQSLNELTTKARHYFAHGVKSCWLVLLPLGNIYVYSNPDEYQIFRAHETLRDIVLDIEIPLQEVFEVQ
ncbi:MAG TPA: Uma2 family endonuclease [Saprospiraceae bacterium]|nr:Uma2 family endonuclease [Saprospiraceae bacterium]